MAANGLPSGNRDRPLILLGHDQEVARWVANELNISHFDPCSSIGIVLNGKIIAGVVYHQFRWPSIEASIASISPKWATRKVLRVIFGYPFLQLNCRNMVVITDAENQPVRAFLERLGFRFACILDQANDTGDAALYQMIPQGCPWIEVNNGKKQRLCA